MIEFQLSYLKSENMMLLTCYTQYASKFGKLISSHRTEKGQFSKKGNAKECSNCRTIAFISHASKVMLKILQATLQQYLNQELPNVKAGFRKGRGTREQIASIHRLSWWLRWQRIYLHAEDPSSISWSGRSPG